jgi:hypothetical protein
MSLEILLIPVAMAAYAAWQARAEAGAQHCLIETRWRHVGLLTQALQDLGAGDVSTTEDSTSATINGVATTFARAEDGSLTAHFPLNTNVEDAVAIVNEVDSSYTRRVQDAVYRRIRAKVTELGYELDSESVQDDETITLVVNV